MLYCQQKLSISSYLKSKNELRSDVSLYLKPVIGTVAIKRGEWREGKVLNCRDGTRKNSVNIAIL